MLESRNCISFVLLFPIYIYLYLIRQRTNKEYQIKVQSIRSLLISTINLMLFISAIFWEYFFLNQLQIIGYLLYNLLIKQFLIAQMTQTQVENLKTQQLWKNSYPLSKMIWQSTYLGMTIILWLWHVSHSIQIKPNPLYVVIGFIVAQLMVDFISGLLHWGCDTWGQFTTPIVGPTLIRSFRMHHVDPQDITKHGFIQTNASTCYPCPPWIIVGLLMTPGSCMFVQVYHWMINFGVPLTIFTNEIHKWAHMVHSKPNKIIRFMQDTRLIISHERHHIHHSGQFDGSYCIINGWMNPFLQAINFWRNAEKIITKLTGAIPRNDDKFWRQLKKVN